MSSNQNVLVLGSKGVIGSALVSLLQKKEYDVTEWDIKIDATHDLSNPLNNPALLRVVSEADFVFFLAFDVGGSKFISEPSVDFMNRNTQIMANTFSALPGKNFIFASSTMSNMGVPYGTLKLIGQHYTELLGGISARFWNVYGPEEYGKRSHVITDFIQQYLTTGRITMLTDGSESRQFLHADDCAECLEIMLQNYDKMRPVVDITSFQWTSISTVANLICDDVHVSTIAEDSHTKVNEPEDFILSFWSPRVSLKEGIAQILEKQKSCF